MDRIQLAESARGFIDSLRNITAANDLELFASGLSQVDTSRVQRGPIARLNHPTLSHLYSLSKQLREYSMSNAVKSLDWGQVYGGGGIDAALAEGMFAAQAAGTYGVFESQELACGLFLLGPNVYYPLHTHAAHEVYHCLAGQIEITHKLNETPFTLYPDQSSETPSGRLHSLKTDSSPVLLAYIWMGDITAPTWWWEQGHDGSWIRTAWRRNPGESWKVDCSEPVDDNAFNAAMR